MSENGDLTPEEELIRQYGTDRDLDLESLKALAHPLRGQILDALSVYGSFTASGLAERLGESSGATSYHLRQLERHGFVREVAGKGSGRERWWERVPGGLNIGSDDARKTPAGREASTIVFRQMQQAQRRMLDDFVTRADTELSPKWIDAGSVSTMNTRLTPTQLRAFVGEFSALVEKWVLPNKNSTAAGSRPVHIEFNAFPVLDGTVIEGDDDEAAEQ